LLRQEQFCKRPEKAKDLNSKEQGDTESLLASFLLYFVGAKLKKQKHTIVKILMESDAKKAVFQGGNNQT
jgi:hypothetical protein